MNNKPDPTSPLFAPSETPGLPSDAPLAPRDQVLSDAIAQTLQAPADQRAALFGRLVKEAEAFIHAITPESPWTCTLYIGTDQSHIFRGGVGHSLVIDPQGRLWRARSYEDFETTYTITETTCTIETLTPLYDQMREYLPRVSKKF
ncbi:MAG: hypothetical protein LCH81_15830 [Bacteroidetes bacterium]|nr:hypothetical protein [Bacteroidota bacterium]